MSTILEKITNKWGIRRYIGPKRVVLAVLIISFVLCAWHLYQTGILTPATVARYREVHPTAAVVLFVLIYAASVVSLLPSMPLNLAAGLFWGGWLGGVYATVGTTLGGWISFGIARWLIGQPLTTKINKDWAVRVQREFERNGWKFVAFARVNPIVPTGPLNYLLGLTSLSHKAFLMTTFFFLLPPATAVAFIGDAFQTLVFRQALGVDLVRNILVGSAAVTLLVGLKFVLTILNRKQENT